MIETADLERLDERYVKKDDCTVLRSETDRRLDGIKEDVYDIKSEIAVNKTKMNILIAVLSAIAVPVLSMAVKYLFGA